MAHARGKMVGKRGSQQAEEADRPDHRRRRRHERGNPKQQPQSIARVVYAQINRLVASQKMDVQTVPLAPNHHCARQQNQRAHAQKLAVDRIEVRKHIRLRRRKFLRINHARQQRREAAEQNPENHANQNHARQIASALPDERVKQKQRTAHHHHQLKAELARQRQRRIAHPAQGKQQKRLQKHIQRVEAQNRRRKDRVVRQRLEKLGRNPDRIRHQQQSHQLGQPQLQYKIPIALDVQSQEQGATSEQ